jgi:ABC-type lipoprotein release transport system permease subunit
MRRRIVNKIPQSVTACPDVVIARRFEVTGIFVTGLNEYDNSYVVAGARRRAATGR